MSQTVRTFVAIEIPDEVAEALVQLQEQLQELPQMEELRWVEPADSHMTLKFLGETAIPQLPEIVEALDGVAEQWEPFTVRLGGLGAFPNVFQPTVLWLGVEEGAGAFQHLYNAVEVALKRVGIKPERKPFHPHLTLARVPQRWGEAEQRALGELIGPTPLPPLPPFPVDALALIRSQLLPEGPHYTRLGNSHFGEAPPLEEDDWEDIP